MNWSNLPQTVKELSELVEALQKKVDALERQIKNNIKKT